ncbi:MAG TPA: hypothetical protein PKD24_01790 [Pyrinomonadaceae bacterium]|nr:hypothetical protein [Pyrinomonadaceae bacterium]HMP64111.1 hypothetical protein [Pyrinomonadaceae bacterium]
MANFDLSKYIPVHARISEFYEKYPDGRIVTKIMRLNEDSGFVCIKASAFRNGDDAEPSSTGHAFEIRGQGYVNTTSFIENGETSAVGRALANLGFKIDNGIASREEMQKVERMTEAPKPTTNNGRNGHNGRLVTQSVS